MKTRAAWVAILLLGALGCGQKGPLYLPDHAGAVVTRPAAGAQDTGATSPTQQPGAAGQPASAQQPGAAQRSGAAQQPGAAQQANGTVAHKNSGKDDDSTQK